MYLKCDKVDNRLLVNKAPLNIIFFFVSRVRDIFIFENAVAVVVGGDLFFFFCCDLFSMKFALGKYQPVCSCVVYSIVNGICDNFSQAAKEKNKRKNEQQRNNKKFVARNH